MASWNAYVETAESITAPAFASGDNGRTMWPRLIIALVLLLASSVLQAQCKPGPNYHCVDIAGFAYVPNLLTVVEGDTVEFAASSFHPLRQVIRALPSTTGVVGGLLCESESEPCVQVMDATIIDADGQPIFHFICVTHATTDVMRGDITILPRNLFVNGFED
jgi:hypothetical protein